MPDESKDELFERIREKFNLIDFTEFPDVVGVVSHTLPANTPGSAPTKLGDECLDPSQSKKRDFIKQEKVEIEGDLHGEEAMRRHLRA